MQWVMRFSMRQHTAAFVSIRKQRPADAVGDALPISLLRSEIAPYRHHTVFTLLFPSAQRALVLAVHRSPLSEREL
jgi:hypothetical protein